MRPSDERDGGSPEQRDPDEIGVPAPAPPPTSAADEARADAGVVVQDVVYAGLDALASSLRLDLCAYLHLPAGQGPQLFLEKPSLSSVDPTQAFNLFTALRDALSAGETVEEEEGLEIAGYLAMTVKTRGSVSGGMHVVGRREGGMDRMDRMDRSEREAVARLARRFGAAAHAIEALAVPPTGFNVLRVSIEALEDRSRAAVEVTGPGGVRAQTAESPTPARAVAAAALAAVSPALKLIEASEDEVGGERAVLVLARDETGRGALGAALVGESADPLRATARAALDAAARLAVP